MVSRGWGIDFDDAQRGFFFDFFFGNQTYEQVDDDVVELFDAGKIFDGGSFSGYQKRAGGAVHFEDGRFPGGSGKQSLGESFFVEKDLVYFEVFAFFVEYDVDFFGTVIAFVGIYDARDVSFFGEGVVNQSFDGLFYGVFVSEFVLRSVFHLFFARRFFFKRRNKRKAKNVFFVKVFLKKNCFDDRDGNRRRNGTGGRGDGV